MRISDWSSDVCSSDLFSILPCSNDDAGLLVEDERIRLLSFTGGLVGWDLKARAGKKKVVLELGGNAACIVDDEPGLDLDAVVERIVFGAYYQSGQSCIGVQRIFAHAGVYERLRRQIGRAHGCTPVTHAHLVSRLL